ncbi:MAG: Hydroxylamine oxidoreductase, partial [Labilithrix sp.]|nr:Hydroxylamine oxidoreductase [Labilithrix sp.]
MSFRSIFITVVIGTALVVGAFLINQRRPAVERSQPTPALVLATGKCAECHRRETSAIIDQYERSRHAEKGVNCLDCHKPQDGQPSMEHRGFTIAKSLTAKNCAQCHATEYEQFARSRHAAPAWASVNGAKDMSPEQRALGEKYHPTWVDRPPMAIGVLEGQSA